MGKVVHFRPLTWGLYIKLFKLCNSQSQSFFISTFYTEECISYYYLLIFKGCKYLFCRMVKFTSASLLIEFFSFLSLCTIMCMTKNCRAARIRAWVAQTIPTRQKGRQNDKVLWIEKEYSTLLVSHRVS